MNPGIRQRLDEVAERFEELEHLLVDPDTINNRKQFQSCSREYGELEPIIRLWQRYGKTEQAATEARELLSDGDGDMQDMAEEEIERAEAEQDELARELQRLLLPKDPNDDRNIFLEVRAGTGGLEAALFAGDLLRMYSRYAESRGWKVEIMSAQDGEAGGYREVIARIIGPGAYSRLKFESGAHRVQRVPATESQGRIHTSACTVAILPEIDSVDEIDINPNDLRIDTYRSSGAGGQHVNTTDSAVRITHQPTGIVVANQSGRSQHQNKDQAMKQLRAKLYELELQKLNEEKQAAEESKSDIGWGSQIRSYVLDDQRIKDLRTKVETSNTQNVLDGALDQFIIASLKQGL